MTSDRGLFVIDSSEANNPKNDDYCVMCVMRAWNGFESKERLRSSEIKEDGLRFIERQCDQPQSRWF